MGNCLIVGEKVIKVMKPDGKILEYRSPIKVDEVLSEFTGHAMSSESTTTPATQHLRPETKLQGGHLYYLVPLPQRPQRAAVKKKVRFSEPEKEAEHEQEKKSKVVRIKLVINKQQLQELLRKGGVSVEDMISDQLHDGKRLNGCDGLRCDDDQREGDWKPVLESIAEVN